VKREIYDLLEGASLEEGKGTDFYDITMMAAIMASMIPLMPKESYSWTTIVDWSVSALFIIDYALRWWTADVKLKKGAMSYVIYPVTPMAIVDLLSILPAFTSLAAAFRLFRLSRLFRTFREFRAFKLIRYSKSCLMIRNAIRSQRHALISAYAFAIFYQFVSALLVFNVEPQTFDTFWDALYWSAVSLTTVGYGDIYPVSATGRCVTVVSAFVGIAIVALPAGIITAGYMAELAKQDKP
jgi:voltage-gated potassium channel